MGKGGIIGPSVATPGYYKGVWNLREQYNAKRNNLWPSEGVFTMTAGDYLNADVYFGYISPAIVEENPCGSISNEPFPGQVLSALIDLFGVFCCWFSGDITSFLAGKKVYIDGVLYEPDAPSIWFYSSEDGATLYGFDDGGTFTSYPVYGFVENQTYTIEIK